VNRPPFGRPARYKLNLGRASRVLGVPAPYWLRSAILSLSGERRRVRVFERSGMKEQLVSAISTLWLSMSLLGSFLTALFSVARSSGLKVAGMNVLIGPSPLGLVAIGVYFFDLGDKVL